MDVTKGSGYALSEHDMESTTTTTREYSTFDGPLHVGFVVVLGIALLLLFAWSLRRERQILGQRETILFGVLRTAALLAALWMLLAPVTVRTESSKTRKSVAMVVDVSPSMLTVDHAIDREDARWTLATLDDNAQNAVVSADRALAAATTAAHRLDEAVSAVIGQQAESVALESTAAAHDGVERAKQHVAAVSDQLASSSIGEGTRAQVAQVAQILDGDEFDRLATLATTIRRGSASIPSGWHDALTDWAYQMAGVRRRLAALAEQLADNRDLLRQGTAPTAVSDTRQAPRLARVASFLDSLDATVLTRLREEVDIQHASFDRTYTPLANAAAAKRLCAHLLAANAATQRDTQAADLPVTDVTAALEQLLRTKQEQPLAAIFLFTDAAHTRPGGRDPRVAAADLVGTPVYVVSIGSTQHVRDVDLKAISAPGVVMKDDDVVIEATLQAFDCRGEVLRVELLRDGEVIQERDLQVDSAIALSRARFHTRLDEVGVQRFQVRAVPLEDELSEDNNFGQVEVNVTRDQIAVLLADELPRWEFRYLTQLFRRDVKVDCDELLFRPRMLATGRRGKTGAFPVTVDEWGQYDVVMLGDVSSQNLPIAAQQALSDYVRERGGTLIIIAGQEHMPQGYINQPLEALLPVTRASTAGGPEARGGFAFHLTEEGWQHPALMIADTQESTRIAWDFINRNSPLYALSPYRHAKPTARTLITATSRAAVAADADSASNALLCWQPVGRGRVVYLASPETYRLRFLRGDRLHYRFWGQLLRWAIASDLAAGTELVSIQTDRPDYRTGDRVDVVVRMTDGTGRALTGATVEAVASTQHDDQQGRSRIAVPLQPDESIPGRYIGSFHNLASGIYRVEPAGLEVEQLQEPEGDAADQPAAAKASFTVRAPLNRELLDTRSDRALAQQIADATGGQVLPPTAVREVLALTDLSPIVTESTQALPLWVQWKFLWIIFGCLCTEWVIRKQLGLS